MPIEINYDELGKPKTVVLSYEEYQAILEKPDERFIAQQTASKITELIQQFIRDEECTSIADELTTEEAPKEEEFSLSEEDEKEIPEEKQVLLDVRWYKNAKGYYDSQQGFIVLKGSTASGYPSHTFEGLESAVRLRNQLIERGILTRCDNWGNYTFTKDYQFKSPSAAACIVDGNSRSGPACWGRK